MNSRSSKMLVGVERVPEENPWIRSQGPDAAMPVEVAPEPPPAPLLVSAPQGGVPTPDQADRLPWRQANVSAALWWLGVHGGAGESTLARLAIGTRAAEHAWPLPATLGIPSRVILVARTHFTGLTAAQHAAQEWASGAFGDAVRLEGLLLIPDQPGRLPKPLRQLVHLVGGGVPHTWMAPWVDSWRYGPVDPSAELPRGLGAVFSALLLHPSGSRS